MFKQGPAQAGPAGSNWFFNQNKYIPESYNYTKQAESIFSTFSTASTLKKKKNI